MNNLLCDAARYNGFNMIYKYGAALDTKGDFLTKNFLDV